MPGTTPTPASTAATLHGSTTTNYLTRRVSAPRLTPLTTYLAFVALACFAVNVWTVIA